jgi:hypothetical protein
MNFQIFLNLVGAGTDLGLGSRKECARARASVAHVLSLSHNFFNYFLFFFLECNFFLRILFLIRNVLVRKKKLCRLNP